MTSPGFRIRIEFHSRVWDLVSRPDEFLLDAAARHGLWLPRVCCQGWCATCAARVVRGAAEHSSAKRFYPEDEAAGFALLCTARALSPMTVLAGQNAALREHRINLGLPVPRA